MIVLLCMIGSVRNSGLATFSHIKSPVMVTSLWVLTVANALEPDSILAVMFSKFLPLARTTSVFWVVVRLFFIFCSTWNDPKKLDKN